VVFSIGECEPSTLRPIQGQDERRRDLQALSRYRSGRWRRTPPRDAARPDQGSVGWRYLSRADAKWTTPPTAVQPRVAAHLTVAAVDGLRVGLAALG
jgi:hypothetical protein